MSPPPVVEPRSRSSKGGADQPVSDILGENGGNDPVQADRHDHKRSDRPQGHFPVQQKKGGDEQRNVDDQGQGAHRQAGDMIDEQGYAGGPAGRDLTGLNKTPDTHCLQQRCQNVNKPIHDPAVSFQLAHTQFPPPVLIISTDAHYNFPRRKKQFKHFKGRL